MKHLLIALMLLSSFAFVIGCTQPAEDVEDTEEVVVCEECGADPCECEAAAEVCDECGKEECECEAVAEVCEACGEEECTCPVEEEVVEEGE